MIINVQFYKCNYGISPRNLLCSPAVSGRSSVVAPIDHFRDGLLPCRRGLEVTIGLWSLLRHDAVRERRLQSRPVHIHVN